MVDYFALALSHGLLMLAALRLMRREDLDRDLPVQQAAPASEAAADPPGTPRLRTHA